MTRLPFIVFGLVFAVFGLVAFIRIDVTQRAEAARILSIQDGKVQPEPLTVIRKYVNPGRHGGHPHVVFSSARVPRVNLGTTQQFYDSVTTNSIVSGYYFPDGYFVPQSHGQDAGLAKWIFLSSGLLIGCALLVVAFTMKTPGGPAPDLQTLLAALRDRGKNG